MGKASSNMAMSKVSTDGECGVCYEIPREISVKSCECRELLCGDCFNRLDKCPFCRKVFVSSPGNWLSSAEVRLAEQHWLYWFTRMNGYEIIQEVQLIRQLADRKF